MTHTARVTPTGTPFDEGFSSKITFSLDSDLPFWEKTVGAPGIDGGDPIPTSTMFNTAWHTMVPRTLKRMTPFQVQGAFSSGTIDAVLALVNQRNGYVTITWPDGTYYSFPGYLKSFTPGQAAEGNPLDGTIEVVPTCTVSNVEEGPDVHEQGTGT